MGFGNAGLVRLRWTHLPGNAYKLLNEMAWCTIDDAAPPVYFGGMKRLASALGRTVTSDGLSLSDKSAVLQALRHLTSAGVIECLRRPTPGANAVYALHLHQARTGAGNLHPSAGAGQATADGSQTRTGAENPLEQVQETCTRTGAGFLHPKQIQEVDTNQEHTSPQVSSSPDAPQHEDDHHPCAGQIAALRTAARRRRAPPADTPLIPAATCP